MILLLRKFIIFSIFFCLIITFMLPCFGAESDLIFGYPCYLYQYNHNKNNGSWSLASSKVINDFESNNTAYLNFGPLGPNYSIDNSKSIFAVPVIDSNGIRDYLHSDYSYVISYFYNFKIPYKVVNDSEVPILPLPTNYDFWLLDGMTSEFNNLSGLIPASSSLENYSVVPATEKVGQDSSYYYYTYVLSYSFTVPSDLNLSAYALACSVLDYRVEEMLASTGSSLGVLAYQVYGVYDPDGGHVDTPSEVDDIIQGQKEAAEYALAQEQLANQEVYDGAVDQDTSVFDLSDLVGSFSSLYTGLTYSGTDFNFTFPSSGVVPGFDMQLWDQQDIPLKYYIDQIPEPILIIVRAVFWIFVAICVIRMMYKVLGFINGHKGDDS